MKLFAAATFVGAFAVCFDCMLDPVHSVAAEESPAVERNQQTNDPPSGIVERIRALYPDLQLERDGDTPYISLVREVARVATESGHERLVVLVHITVPASRVDHGQGELLVFRDTSDSEPMIRKSTHSVPVVEDSRIRLIEGRWLQFGAGGTLVSLVDESSLKHFKEQGDGLIIQGLSVAAVTDALELYVDDGRAAFLERAPIRRHRERHVSLPERISRFELYPSLVEDMRYARFRYSDAWEATVLVRLTSDERPRPTILEIGARASSAGITQDEVELLLWESREVEPGDRPAPFSD